MVIFESDMMENAYRDTISMKNLMREWNRQDIIYALESSSEGIITKALKLIKHIIDEVKKMIGKCKESIEQKIRYGMLSKKSKEEYNKFCEFVKSNPQIKEQKVLVRDWSRIYKEYDKVEDTLKKMMNDRSLGADAIVLKANKLFSDINTVLNLGSASITVDMCMVLARKSPEMAKQIQTALNINEGILKNIEEELGKKEATRLQKNVDRLSRESTMQKIMASFYARKEKTVSECMKEMLDTFSELSTTKGKIKAAVEHRDLVRTYGKKYITDKNTRDATNSIIKKGSDAITRINGEDSVIGTLGEIINPKTKKYT